MNFKDEERQAYEEHLKWFMTEAAALRKLAENKFAEGEQAKTLEIAKNFLTKGLDMKMISDATELSVGAIEGLKHDNAS